MRPRSNDAGRMHGRSNAADCHLGRPESAPPDPSRTPRRAPAPASRARRALALAALLPLLLVGFASCTTGGSSRDPTPGGGRAAAALPWEIPAADWGTRRIVRLRYAGPEGKGTLRLVLRFESPDRFQVQASDRLGRRWWDLNVQEGEALVLWVRERTFCRYGGALEIPALSLGPVPAGAVAALLLGRLPAPPLDPGTVAAAGASSTVELDFEDRWRRRWTAVTTRTGPRRWSLHRGDGTRASWSLDAAGLSRLVEPETGLELLWRQNSPVRDLEDALPAPEVPYGFVPGACRPGDR